MAGINNALRERTVPAAAISRRAARFSMVCAVTFVVLLAALHFVKPELDPSWHFISEYSIGANGWMMDLAFVALALSWISLCIAVRPQIHTLSGTIGLILMLVSAAGLLLAAIFTTDPITTAQEAMTADGKLHNLGGTLGIAMPFAALFICWSLARSPAWSSARKSLQWATGLAWIGFLVSFLSLGVMLSQSGGKFGANVLVGWPNRFEILAYSVWLMVVARGAAEVTQSNLGST